MAAGSTYTPIATTTLGSAASSYTFSSIPSTYTDLVLIQNSIQTGTPARWTTIRLNGDTATNYSYTSLEGNGSTAGSYRESSQTRGAVSFAASSSTAWGQVIMNFQNYSNTTTYKTVISRGANAAQGTDSLVTLWRSTTAINTILITLEGSAQQFATGSTFTLYGIAAA
jgi:hypothetical protein